MARPTLSLSIALHPHVRVSYIALATVTSRRTLHSTARRPDRFERSDFSGQGFTGEYEAGLPTGGPLGDASIAGVPKVTPKALKDHLDQFVVGQERAKKVLSVAVYNHYQRVQEVQRREEEQARLEAEHARRNRHPVEDEYPGQQHIAPLKPLFASHPDPPKPEPVEPVAPPPKQEPVPEPPIIDTSPLTIEKSNVLLLGPSGVGKTLMIKTLARVLDVPVSISDCTPFTSAGYIGEDVEVCVQRLISAANFDIAAAERGIIVLDEVDKIAAARVNHGKDVGGEGVQQALLKIIEGTTLQIKVNQERSANHSGRAGQNGSAAPPATKGEVINIRTDNILFICAGAFGGLHKMVLDRVAKGGLGFGAEVRRAPTKEDAHDTMLTGEDEMFKKHLPFFVRETTTPQGTRKSESAKRIYNTLDLVLPSDLQKFGMIPELIGRIPISCALSALDEESLVRVLTEPRNSLLGQFEQLFKLSGIELGFTSGALREVAKSATSMGTGARALRTVLERLLHDCMYETPGSSTKHILITQPVAQLKQPPLYFRRDEKRQYNRLFEEEEQAWQDELDRKNGVATSQFPSFEDYRTKSLAAGIS
ncbi:ATPase, AAA family protein [Lophium mytilinum]|uniref:ATPase, AAA family protein n=1 Tax=Lophium mytilinum TaxID=390894 RepID=A0A6A6QGV9_9PEZI|nr:ATPase, AAA family protein [Lophium mytilinum]